MPGMSSGDARTAVAVIGAGIMGSAMTRNLVAAGLNTRVWDRSTSATASLADAGAVVAASARDAVKDAGVVITMLPTADVVDSVIFDGGAIDAFADGTVSALRRPGARETGWPLGGPASCLWTPQSRAARDRRSRASC